MATRRPTSPATKPAATETQVLNDWELPSADIHAVYPARRNLSAKVIAFVDHLSARLAPQASPTAPASW